MSKIKLTPNASGTGVFTIESPNSNTDYTINLPEISGGEFVATDASGNVGIGTAPTPGLKLDVVSASGSTYAGIRRNSQSAGEVGLSLYGGTSGINWTIYQPTSSNDIRFYGNGADRLTIDSSGNAFFYANGGELRFTGHSFYRPGAFGSGIHLSTDKLLPANENGSVSDNTEDLGSATHRWKDLYLSGGAYLGGTAAANHLDDYEEGTWTPRYTASSGGNIGGSQVHSAVYTKIGNIVTVEFYLFVYNTSVSGLSGNVYISGLPFTATGLAAPSPVRTTDDINVYGAFTNAPTMAAASGSTLALFKQRSGQVEQFLQVGDFVAAVGNRNLVFIKHVYQA